MARLNKTSRLAILSAIVADSKFSNVGKSHSEVLSGFVDNYIDKVYNNPEILAAYKALEEFRSTLPTIVKQHLNPLSIKNATTYVSVNYKLEGDAWGRNLTHTPKEGAFTPNYINFAAKGNEEALAEMVEVLKVHDKLVLEKSAFTSKVMNLLMSVNTTNQLQDQLPQFSKYLPEEVVTSKPKKTDIKDVMSALNQ